MLTDVSDGVFALQEQGFELFSKDSSGAVGADPNKVVPDAGIQAAEWRVLDPQKPDGLSVGWVDYKSIKLDKVREAGELFAVDRTNGSPRLYLVWASRAIAAMIRQGGSDPLNFHVLFHPPTWESCYKRTPYWNGVCSNWHPVADNEKDVCVQNMDQKPLYVRLGLRYCSQYSLAIPQHLIAVRGREPLVIYVTPVSDFHDFPDLVQTSTMLGILQEIADFLTAKVTAGKQTQYPGTVGKIILSGYSRSGTRLVSIMNSLSGKDVFFSKHLSQINAFDINLGNNQAEREAAFNPLWNQIVRWKLGGGGNPPVNRDGRVCVYTAYRYHANYVLGHSQGGIGPPTTLNLESPILER